MALSVVFLMCVLFADGFPWLWELLVFAELFLCCLEPPPPIQCVNQKKKKKKKGGGTSNVCVAVSN